MFQNTICYSELKNVIEIHISIYSDFKQHLSHLLQAYCGESKESSPSGAYFALTSQTLQVIFSLHLPLEEPSVLFITESPSISPPRTQDLSLSFSITYFSLSCTRSEFGIKHRTYHHLTSHMFSYPSVFCLSPHIPLLSKCNFMRVKTRVSFHYYIPTVYLADTAGPPYMNKK